MTSRLERAIGYAALAASAALCVSIVAISAREFWFISGVFGRVLVLYFCGAIAAGAVYGWVSHEGP